jgi:hypothetical protein
MHDYGQFARYHPARRVTPDHDNGEDAEASGTVHAEGGTVGRGRRNAACQLSCDRSDQECSGYFSGGRERAVGGEPFDHYGFPICFHERT